MPIDEEVLEARFPEEARNSSEKHLQRHQLAGRVRPGPGDCIEIGAAVRNAGC